MTTCRFCGVQLSDEIDYCLKCGKSKSQRVTENSQPQTDGGGFPVIEDQIAKKAHSSLGSVVRRSINLIEIVMYLALGLTLSLVIGLSTGEPVEVNGTFLFMGTMLISYAFYAVMVRSLANWEFDDFTKILLMLVGLLIFVAGDLIRRLAFVFYAGDKPVEVVFGGPLEKVP